MEAGDGARRCRSGESEGLDASVRRPGRAGGRALRRPLTLALALLLAACLASGQDGDRLEAEARRAFDTGRFREAGEKYSRAAAAAGLTPERKADLHLQGAWAYYIAGNSKAAREQLKGAFGARPDLEVISDFYSPDFARMAQMVRAEVVGPSGAPAVDLEKVKRVARENLAGGKPEEALAELERLGNASDPDAHRLLAEVYDRLGRAAEADGARRRASDIERGLITSAPIGATSPLGLPPSSVPVNVAPLLEGADKAMRDGDLREAIALARRAAEADPKSAEAHRLLGEAALALGEEADAEREFTAAVVLDSASARAEFGLARLAEKQKKWNTAASHYRRALDLDPRNVEAARGLGRSMGELGDATAARLAYGRAVEMDTASAAAHNDFGVFLLGKGEIDRAIAELIEAVRLEPDLPVLHENLGRAFAKQGMAREAERELAEAARLAPNDVAVWNALAAVRAGQKKAAEAAAAYEAAVRLQPSNAEAASGLGAALAEAGKLEEAEAALVEALEVNPGSAVLWNDLGVVRVRRGAYAGAVEALRRALQLDSQLEPAKANLLRAEKLHALARAES